MPASRHSPSSSSPSPSPDTPARPVLRTACDQCRASKVKCSGDKPACASCRRHGLACVYSARSQMGKPRGTRHPRRKKRASADAGEAEIDRVDAIQGMRKQERNSREERDASWDDILADLPAEGEAVQPLDPSILRPHNAPRMLMDNHITLSAALLDELLAVNQTIPSHARHDGASHHHDADIWSMPGLCQTHSHHEHAHAHSHEAYPSPSATTASTPSVTNPSTTTATTTPPLIASLRVLEALQARMALHGRPAPLDVLLVATRRSLRVAHAILTTLTPQHERGGACFLPFVALVDNATILLEMACGYLGPSAASRPPITVGIFAPEEEDEEGEDVQTTLAAVLVLREVRRAEGAMELLKERTAHRVARWPQTWRLQQAMMVRLQGVKARVVGVAGRVLEW